jgi:arylsulfatase
MQHRNSAAARGNYSDSLMELDADIGRIMDAIRAEAPNTIVIVTADNGAWVDAYPDAGTSPFRGEKGTPFRRRLAHPRDHVVARSYPSRLRLSRDDVDIDCWATLAAIVGPTPPPHDWVANDGKRICFDSIDHSAYFLGTTPHSARTSWIYVDGESFWGGRADIGDDPK